MGRGAGILGKYIPWILVHEVPSRGIRGRIKGWKTGRIHHLLSRHEIHYFLILMWASDVIDVREQYPLLSVDLSQPVSETLQIAKRLGYKHPTDPPNSRDSCPIVLTTDFLITVRRNGENITLARTVKQGAELEDPRVLEKFEIEKEYWKARGIDWAIVIAEDISTIVATNIDWIYQAGLQTMPRGKTRIQLERIHLFLRPRIKAGVRPLSEVCLECDQEFTLRRGVTLGLVRLLIAKRCIPADLTVPIDTSKPLRLLRQLAANGPALV